MLQVLARSVRSARLASVRNASIVISTNRKGEYPLSTAGNFPRRLGFTSVSTNSSAKSSSVAASDNTNPVLEFLGEEGFSDNQITKIRRRQPGIFSYNPENIKLKIEFLKSLLESPEVVRVMSSYPEILTFSLNKTLIPGFKFLLSIFESHDMVLYAVRRHGDALLVHPGSKAALNLEMLIQCGMPRSKLVYFLARKCQALRMTSRHVGEAVEEVKKMGFSLKTSMFAKALMAFLMLTNEVWEQKVKFFKDCGWTEEEFVFAFRRNPDIAICRNDKIAKIFNYLKELGIKPGRIATYPNILGMSFEKRIIPRASVYKVLASRGLLSESVSLYTMFCDVEKNFVRRFVELNDVNGLKKLYQKELQIASQTCRVS